MGASYLEIEGFDKTSLKTEIISITGQAISPLRRRIIEGLKICTIVPNTLQGYQRP